MAQRAYQRLSEHPFLTRSNPMSKIDVLAVGPSGPITTKTALRTLIKSNPEAVKLLPANDPTPGTEAFRNHVNRIPFGLPVTVHTGKSTAEVERKFDGKIVVR
jgi:hypothetical protein